MIEFHPPVKLAHVSAAIASGLLFRVPGSMLQGGVAWAMTPSLRYLSYAIDTVLLYCCICAIARSHVPLGPFQLVGDLIS